MIRFKSHLPTPIFLASLFAALASPFSLNSTASDIKVSIAAAIADPARPDSDRMQDTNRKSQQVLEFSGVMPGDRVADFIPGRGYVTRLLSKIVGAQGHVYAFIPKELPDKFANGIKAVTNDSAYNNVSVVRKPVNHFDTPEKLDLVWTSMNYHDLRLDFLGPANITKLNSAIYDALKPGGIYLILDHSAETGSGLRDTSTLHRIDPSLVKEEVEAAGFELVAEADILNNPADDHMMNVFKPDIRGRTDKFIFKFRKPK